MSDVNCNESGMAGLGAAHGSARRWCRWILNNGDQCKGKPLPITSVAGRKDLCPVHAYLEGDFDEAPNAKLCGGGTGGVDCK